RAPLRRSFLKPARGHPPRVSRRYSPKRSTGSEASASLQREMQGMWRHFIPRALALISAITLGAAFVWYQANAARGPVQDDATPEAASQEPPQPAAYASPADASQTGAATGEGSHPFFPSSKALIL